MESEFPPAIDHVGIAIKNMERGFEFFSRLFGVKISRETCAIMNFDESVCPNLKGGGYKLALVPTGGPRGAKLELYEAREEGWEHDLLEKVKGDMAVGEIGFRVRNIEKYYDKAKEMGLTPTDVNGEPLVDRKFDVAVQAGSETRFFFLNLSIQTQKGPVIEVVEEVDSLPQEIRDRKSFD